MVQSLPDFLTVMFAFIVGITFHEWGHAFVATKWGDDTPQLQGRVTLNPIDHLDPIGTLFIAVTALFGFGFGWGRPVQVNALRFKSYRKGMFWVAAAGPIMSISVAAVAAMIDRSNVLRLPEGSPFHDVLWKCVTINVMLFLFNLIPVPPLDGSKMLSSVLDAETSRKYDSIMQGTGMIFFMFVAAGASRVLGPPIMAISTALWGP